MGSCERFKEMPLPIKKELFSNMAIESITEVVYKHAKRVWIDFASQNVGQYLNLYVQSDTSLLAEVFKRSKKNQLETYELNPLFSFQQLDWHGRHMCKKPKSKWNY